MADRLYGGVDPLTRRPTDRIVRPRKHPNTLIHCLKKAHWLDTIYRRIREDAPTRAAAWRQGLRLAAQALEQFPHRCPLAPESGVAPEIRQLLYGRCRILFTVAHDTVYVLHIRHSARQQLTEGPLDEPDAT